MIKLKKVNWNNKVTLASGRLWNSCGKNYERSI